MGALQEHHWPRTQAATSEALRVLIVDDSPMQLRILSISLAGLGYEVQTSESGAEALDLCAAWPPDMVLSDWMMPGMDGLEFCQKFKALPRDGYGYFILLTSKSAKDEVAQGLENGADDFLTKPVNSHELRARLAAGERIVQMQRELAGKNRMISDTLAELQEIHDSLNSDLIEAKKLQQSLIREKHKSLGNASLSFLLKSSGHVGGDLVGYFPISEEEVGLYAIDVSGHGISSALMTARLAGYLSSPSPDHNLALVEGKDGTIVARAPAEVVEDLNLIVLNEMETDHYFTMILAIANTKTGCLTLCQAGHPHPMVQKSDGATVQDGTGGLPVGLLQDATFDQFHIRLNAGDRLVLSSDGITECPNPQGDLLGEAGFDMMMRDVAHLRDLDMLDALMWRLSEYAGDVGFPDDVSAAVLEYHPMTGH